MGPTKTFIQIDSYLSRNAMEYYMNSMASQILAIILTKCLHMHLISQY